MNVKKFFLVMIGFFLAALTVKAQQNEDSLKLQGNWKLTEVLEEKYGLITNVLIGSRKLHTREEFQQVGDAICLSLVFMQGNCHLQTFSVDDYFDYTVKNNRILIFRKGNAESESHPDVHLYTMEANGQLIIKPSAASYMENGVPVKRVLTLTYKKN